jgi:hypothetical protein
MSDDDPREQTIEIFGNLADVLPYTQPVYRRTVQTRSVTFTCQRCGQTVTQQRFPGPTPRYCGDWCRGQARRSRTRIRVQLFRARQHKDRPDDDVGPT